MWKKFINWLKSLFGRNKKETVTVVGEEFSGWIKDTPDARDQVYTTEVK